MVFEPPPLFEHGNVHGMLAVHADNVVLKLTCINGFPHVSNKNGLPNVILLVRLDGHGVDLLDDRNLAVGIDVVILRSNAHIARRKNEVRLIDRSHHVHHR